MLFAYKLIRKYLIFGTLKDVINHVLEKKSKIITYQPKKFGKSNIVDKKSVIIEQPKTSHKSSKPKRHTEKIGPNCSSYSDTKK